MAKFIKIEVETDNKETTVKIDNTTDFKDFEATQRWKGQPDSVKTVFVQKDENGNIKIGDVLLQGVTKDLFIEFINQPTTKE